MKSPVCSVVFLLFILLSCRAEQQRAHTQIRDESQLSSIEKADFNPEWLLGEWRRINDKESHQTYEHWKRTDDGDYYGLGFTMVENDTVWQESICFVQRDRSIYIQVVAPGESPVDFELVAIDDAEFRGENPDHDFPKVIHYRLEKDMLVATISGVAKQKLILSSNALLNEHQIQRWTKERARLCSPRWLI